MGLKQRIIGTVLAVATMTSVACVGVGAYDATSTQKDHKTTATFKTDKSVLLKSARATRPLNIATHVNVGTDWYLFQGDRSWSDMWITGDGLVGSLYYTFGTSGNGPRMYYSTTFYNSSNQTVIKKAYNNVKGYGSQGSPIYHQDVAGKIAKGSSYAKYIGYTGAGVYVKNTGNDVQSVRYSFNGG